MCSSKFSDLYAPTYLKINQVVHDEFSSDDCGGSILVLTPRPTCSSRSFFWWHGWQWSSSMHMVIDNITFWSSNDVDS
jgi:hypothetical protein